VVHFVFRGARGGAELFGTNHRERESPPRPSMQEEHSRLMPAVAAHSAQVP